MKNTLYLILKTARLTCVWVPTGDEKMPLACVWVRHDNSRAVSMQNARDEAARVHLCA